MARTLSFQLAGHPEAKSVVIRKHLNSSAHLKDCIPRFVVQTCQDMPSIKRKLAVFNMFSKTLSINRKAKYSPLQPPERVTLHSSMGSKGTQERGPATCPCPLMRWWYWTRSFYIKVHCTTCYLYFSSMKHQSQKSNDGKVRILCCIWDTILPFKIALALNFGITNQHFCAG